MFRNLASHLAGMKTYLFATGVTVVALIGMFTGKLDFNAGFGIIATMGLGSCLRSGIQTRAPADFSCHDDGDASK